MIIPFPKRPLPLEDRISYAVQQLESVIRAMEWIVNETKEIQELLEIEQQLINEM